MPSTSTELPLAVPRLPQHHVPLPFLGLACAVGVSSLYLNQPLLAEMAASFHTQPAQVGLVAMMTQVGYACGLLSFVPLGDVYERRALMMRLYGAVSLALVGAALAPTLGWMVVASLFVGLFAAVTHVVLPIAPDLVDDSARGRAIGTVMTGLLLGILLARTFAGWVSHVGGWRTVFVAAAAINLAFVPLLARILPALPPRQPLSYGAAMRSLATLVRTQPTLREAAAVAALVFAAFSCFWTTLAFLLKQQYDLGPGVAGSFGLVGAAGALVAPWSGRMSDRHGSRWVVSLGLGTLGASFVLLWVAVVAPMPRWAHLAALVVGVIALDTGAQMTQVANQTRVFGLVAGARGRLNTVYMTVYFAGAALGSYLSTLVWGRYGWSGVCGVAMTFLALAALRHLFGRESTRRF